VRRAPGPPLLSELQHRNEALLAAAIAIEHVGIVDPMDSRMTAAYAAAVLDNCRALAADDLRRYLLAVRRHLFWLHSLPSGSVMRRPDRSDRRLSNIQQLAELVYCHEARSPAR
jgi:hypothetical protein